MISHQVISGFGKNYTNKSNGHFYPLIGLDEIRCLADSPQSVAKEKARWALPSSYPSRSHDDQKNNGSYLYLWADLDAVPQGIEYVRDVIESFIDTDYEIYTTHSATLENQKTRVLIPLANAISPCEWYEYQDILNKSICEHKIKPDECNKHYGQFFYLPNRGDFYAHYFKRDGNYLNPALQWNNYLNIKLTERTERTERTEITEITECTEDYRRVQMSTEITDVIEGGDIDYLNLPTDCSPKEEGERNRKLFNFSRYLKRDYPKTDCNQLRPLVLAWHRGLLPL